MSNGRLQCSILSTYVHSTRETIPWYSLAAIPIFISLTPVNANCACQPDAYFVFPPVRPPKQASERPRLRLRRQNHLLSLISSLRKLLLSMLPFILLSPLNSLQFLRLDLASLLDNLRNMSVTLDTADLRHMSVSLCQGFAVFESLALFR